MRDNFVKKLSGLDGTAWRKKLHPAFGEMCFAYKKAMLDLASIQNEADSALRAAPADRRSPLRAQVAQRVETKRNQLLEQMEKDIVDIDAKYKPLPPSRLCFPYLSVLGGATPAEDREPKGLFEWLHWERHHESLENATEADNQGDLSAWDRIARTARDWRTIVFKKGAIKPFQGGAYHQDIFQFGLSFASGIEDMTAEELAYLFDEACPCQKTHDARALAKQLARLVKDLEAAARKS